eukprot:CAMPEP_0171926060 /NCGR_PEP_ID=MMETSP0993-20121228/24602_1 /TAXON_ID=483369 /ORGANISM="non described non described, Strain CCMP2098" /LENGTH=81 /DNA_ID=CAMNT_0012564841 /DNA_START=201 /DNA_END=446 /DNA_ORIENTATION=-
MVCFRSGGRPSETPQSPLSAAPGLLAAYGFFGAWASYVAAIVSPLIKGSTLSTFRVGAMKQRNNRSAMMRRIAQSTSTIND